jgi:hypothetical protein
MKKFLFLLMSVAVLSASAGITKSPLQKKVAKMSDTKRIEQVAKFSKVTPTAKPITFKAPAKVDVPEGYAAVILEAHQVWGEDDNSGYQMLLDADATAYGTEFEEVGGSGTFAGDYAAFEYKIPENADGDLNTENIVYDGSETILIPAGTYDYVLINPTPGDRLWIAAQNGNAGGRGDDFVFKSGCTYHFTVTLNASGNDQTDVVIDDPTAPTLPEITVTPTDKTAYVEWAPDANATGWNLRWRPWTDLSGNPHEWTFPLDSYAEEAADWWVYDMDGDGQNWGFAYSSSAQDDVCLVSGSYTSSGACSPDNWIGTPDVPLKGELHFTMWGASNNYPEVLQVYAMVGEDMYQLFQDSLLTTTTHTVYTVDLSAFDGAEGCIVFRNYSTYDQWSVYVDDIFIGDPNAELIEPAPWNYEYNITDPNFTIRGLIPETKYEVQVEAYNATDATGYCDIVEFITLRPNIYMLGGDDQGWDPTDGSKMFTYDAENNIYTMTYTFPAEYNYFGFTTELAENNDEGGWNYIEPYRFGAIAEGDYWYTGEEDYISLTWDEYHAIRIPAGEYKMTVDLTMMRLIIEPIAPQGMRGDVNNDGNVSIADVTALIDYLLNHDASAINLGNADCNLDENISIADVTALIDYLLRKQW